MFQILLKCIDFHYSLDNLRTYLNETIILELVGDTTVFDINWLSVYDLQTKENYGWVLIPDEPNVPPSLQNVAVSDIRSFIQLLILTCIIYYSNTNLFLG